MFVVKRRSLVIVSVLIITAITFIFCFTALKSNPAGSMDIIGPKIVLDAGHGGIDGGVVGVNSGVKESDINLKVVKKLEKYFSGAGFNVVLTRTSEAGLYGLATKSLKKKDMLKRKEIINESEPVVVVSVHMNKYSSPSRRGAQVFYKKSDERAKTLANCVQNSFNSMEQAVRTCNPLIGDYYILNCSEIPSVIAECGFLSNPEDEALLITDEYQDDLAYAIFKGVVDYLAQETTTFC